MILYPFFGWNWIFLKNKEAEAGNRKQTEKKHRKINAQKELVYTFTNKYIKKISNSMDFYLSHQTNSSSPMTKTKLSNIIKEKKPCY